MLRLRTLALSGLAVAALAACQTTTTTTVSTTAVEAPAAAQVQATAFADLINAERAKSGLTPLRVNAQLTQAARSHAADMARNDYFSHTGLNGSNLSTRARAAGYCRAGIAENIAFGQRSEAQAFTSWLNSSGHRRNMLRRSAVDYGLGESGGKWVLLVADGC